MVEAVTLPNNWQPRPYQMRAWLALESGIRRAVCVWHRRAGKDDVALHWTATAVMQRVGNYWHLLPKQNQARRAIWEAVNPHTGKRRIDEAFPDAIRDRTLNNEMMIVFKNGSTWQVLGSDNYDALVGAPPIGIVFSEFSLSDPYGWDLLRPILAENGGWALFIYTARGKNHGYTLYQMACKNPDWFAELLTVEQSQALPMSVIEDDRKSGMSEDMIQQEYYCSFEAANPGTYYGKHMAAAWKDKRITAVPVEQTLPVHTFWDLGIADSMSIWLTQFYGREIRLVGYYEANGEGMAHYANYLHAWAKERSVRFERHVAPHDIEVRELGSGKSRRETAMTMGIVFQVAKRLEIADGIEAVRRILPRCWFDENACGRGINALTEYSKDWDEKNKVFRDHPRHDWASHGADAFRTMAVSLFESMHSTQSMPASGVIRVQQQWNPIGA